MFDINWNGSEKVASLTVAHPASPQHGTYRHEGYMASTTLDLILNAYEVNERGHITSVYVDGQIPGTCATLTVGKIEDDPFDITTAEAAVILRVSDRTVRRMITRRQLDAKAVGRGWKVSARSLFNAIKGRA